MKDILKNLVYEDERQAPMSIKPAFFIKKLVVIILIIVSTVVLYINLSNKSSSITDNLKHVIYAIVITYMHVSYLYIVLNILILGNPVEKLYKQQLIFPLLLVFSYIFYAFQITAEFSIDSNFSDLEKTFKYISLCLFLLLYLLWFLRDIFEYAENKKTLSMIWIFGDFFSIVCLTLGVFFEFFNIKFDSFIITNLTSLNGPIFICLMIYVFFKIVSGHFINEESYKYIYDKYLSYNKILNEPILNIPFPDDTINILDFGCGDGRRLLENLSWIKNLPNEDKINIYGYDKRKCFKSPFEDKLEDSYKNSKFISNLKEINPNDLQLIILSHVLYEQAIVEEVSAFLKKCKKDTIVYFRGASPNSFFVSTSFAGSNSINVFSRKKNRSHLWYSIWLEDIIKYVGLSHLIQDEKEMVFIVKQNYNIHSKEGIENASELLKRLYSGELALRSDTYFNALKKYANVNQIANDDLIYIYTKK